MKTSPKHKRDAAPPHAAEPWRVVGNRIVDASGHLVAVVDCPTSAARIVAAIKVASEIDTKHLEAMPAGTLKDAMPRFQILLDALRDVNTNGMMATINLETAKVRLEQINAVARLARSQAVAYGS